ncbi:MAG: M23 family metallopeptidase [Dehalococcoidia bacterium]|nr:M23 family metallopeptidase [Dehalococcoidia bacterium]
MPQPQEPPKAITTVQGTLQKPSGLIDPAATDKAAEKKASSREVVVSYTIAEGDTLSGVAERFGLTTQTLIWANSSSRPDTLTLGSELRIPPVSGVLHKVNPGDTLLTLAGRYKVEVTDITGFSANKINNPDALVLGQEITVPRGVKPIDSPPTRLAAAQPAPAAQSPAAAPAAPRQLPAQPVSGGMLQWPTYGPIFTFFGGGHRGLDISPPYGTPVYAAEAGVVVEASAGYNAGYGTTVIINHGNGLTTMYAHLSALAVSIGQQVGRGEHIGNVGTTGRATGPHLHFEVHQSGGALNPLNFLPR